MKIRFLISVGGSATHYEPGQVVDLPEAVALGWADGVRAERVNPEPEIEPSNPQRTPDPPEEFEPPEDQGVETAEAVPAPEAAVTRRGRPRKVAPSRASE